MFLQKEEFAGDISYHFIEQPIKSDGRYKTDQLYIFLFEEGNGKIYIDGESQVIRSRKVIVIFPGQLCSYNIQQGSKAHILIAKKKVYESISSIKHVFVGTLKPISGFDISEDIFRILVFDSLEINRLLTIKDENTEELTISRLRVIYIILKTYCMKARDMAALQVSHPLINKFIELVELHYAKNKDVQFYAHTLNMQPSYLNVLCKKKFQISAKQIIKNRIIKEAKRLLLETDETIKEIGYQLGVCDASHFTTFIKKETGFLPKDFIKLRKHGIKQQ